MSAISTAVKKPIAASTIKVPPSSSANARPNANPELPARTQTDIASIDCSPRTNIGTVACFVAPVNQIFICANSPAITSHNFPINCNLLAAQLSCYPNPSQAKYLVAGLRHGFRVGFHAENIKLQSAARNCPSADEHPEIIDKYLNDEVAAGRVFGPTDSSPCPNLHISRFGAIPKKSKANAWRLILDLSFPAEHSVNDGIFKHEFPVHYSKVDDAIRLIIQAGKGALMAKLDIKNAYRIIPIHPDDRYLFGMKWRNKYFVDLALPFGLRSAPAIFSTFATIFKWTLTTNYQVKDLIHYLDDYFTLGPAGSDHCAQALTTIQLAANDLGVPLAPEKCEGPTTRLVFLGIELDSELMTATLPGPKLAELTAEVRGFAAKKWCSRKSLESLIGKLSHACAVVPSGRTFLRRLLNLLRGSKRHQQFIRLNQQCQLDLLWWEELLPTWNGVSFFDLPDWAPMPDFQVSTDAAGTLGFGAYFQGEWFSAAWLPSQQALGMTYKELYPIVIACHLWGSAWSRHRVLFHCDNLSVVHIIRNGTCQDENVMHLVRDLFLISTKCEFRVSAAHLPGKTNLIADALSRFNFQDFLRLAPGARRSPTVIPESLLRRLTCRL